LLFLG